MVEKNDLIVYDNTQDMIEETTALGVEMEDRNCEVLAEYIHSIMQDEEICQPDLNGLDGQYRKLGEEIQILRKFLEEVRDYSAALSNGRLSMDAPPYDNLLCANLKELDKNLKHLVWQAKQVVRGDYSQQISYPGELCEAFNTMTQRLKEREELLKREVREAQERAEIVAGYNDLLMELTRKRNEWILVIDRENKETMYCNKRVEAESTDIRFCQECKKRLSFQKMLLDWHDEEDGKVWEIEEDGGKAFRITTFPIVWKSRKAYAHIVLDITIEKEKSRRLKAKAYRDQGTGIYNRLYFMERMKRLLEEPQQTALCYMDLDGLKYVNDNYGHLEGDEYIRSFVQAVKNQFREQDMFARIGGDEFCAILPLCPVEIAHQKMKEGLEQFRESHQKEYPASFSYGIVEIKSGDGKKSMERRLEEADIAMYECKRQNKLKYHQGRSRS